MTKLRLLLLSLLAALAVSAVGSASAFAECSGKSPELKCVWDVNGVQVTKPTLVLLLGGLQVLIVKNANVEIDCKKVEADVTFDVKGKKSATSIHYLECKVIKPLTTCEVRSISKPEHKFGEILTLGVSSQLKESASKSGKPVVTSSPANEIEKEKAFVELEVVEKGGHEKCGTLAEKLRITGTITGAVNNTPPGKLEFAAATGLNVFGIAATLTGDLEPDSPTTIAAL